MGINLIEAIGLVFSTPCLVTTVLKFILLPPSWIAVNYKTILLRQNPETIIISWRSPLRLIYVGKSQLDVEYKNGQTGQNITHSLLSIDLRFIGSQRPEEKDLYHCVDNLPASTHCLKEFRI